jgi:hypothetical protein
MKKDIQIVFSVVVIGIGIYLLTQNAWPTPPALSGLAFLLVGYLHFMPYCPLCKAFCK